MNTFSHADLMQLVEAPGDRFVSLYMPTYLAGVESPQNMIRFRKLLVAAEVALGEKGMEKADVRRFLKPARDCLDRPLFWKSLDSGLAMFVSHSGLRVWRLPFACEELCVVAKRFLVTPLLAWLQENTPYYLLAVSQNRVRLLHGTRDELREVAVPRLPSDLIRALHYDQREGSYQTHSGQPQLRGKEGLVFTGQGGEVDVAKAEIASFFKMIDAAVNDFLHSHADPLLFAGVDYLFPIYRQHNHYPRLLPTHISGNPDLLSADDLRHCAWPLIELLLQRQHAAVAEKYWNLVTQGRGSNRIEEIVLAAHAGAVETLFISPTVHRLGTFDPRG